MDIPNLTTKHIRKAYNIMRVSNLKSPRGGTLVANQFIVQNGATEWFQSYQTMIAKKTRATYTISRNYNYSATTSKYFNQWLRSWSFKEYEINMIKKWLKKAKYGDTYDEFETVTFKYVEEV